MEFARTALGPLHVGHPERVSLHEKPLVFSIDDLKRVSLLETVDHHAVRFGAATEHTYKSGITIMKGAGLIRNPVDSLGIFGAFADFRSIRLAALPQDRLGADRVDIGRSCGVDPDGPRSIQTDSVSDGQPFCNPL